MRPIDVLATSLARRQHGAFSRAQLVAGGIPCRPIERRITGGEWLRLASGVYALPSHPGTWMRQVWAAHLAHPGSVVGLDTAAVLHGDEGFRPGMVQLVVPPEAGIRSALARLHRFEGVRTTAVAGLPVTTVAQTMADLCAVGWSPRVEAGLDRLLLARRVTYEQLEERVRFYAGTRRRGHALFEALVQERGDAAWAPSESELEDRLRRLVRRLPGPPEVVWQPRLPWRPTTGERVDGLLPGPGVILEADGRAWHARVQDFDRDRWRDSEAVAHGLVVMRFTWVHLTQRLGACAALVRQAIDARRPRGRRHHAA